MKKLLCLISVMCLLATTLVGCTPNNKELWDAYVKTSKANSSITDMSFTIKTDASNVKDMNIKMALSLLDGVKMDFNAKTLKDSKGITKAAVSGSVVAMQTPYKFDVWVDSDLTDTHKPKLIEIFKYPENMPNFPKLFSSRYAYVDLANAQKTENMPQIDFDGYKNFMDPSKLLDTLKNIDTTSIKVDKKVVGSNKEFTLSLNNAVAKSLTSQYCDAIFNGPMLKSIYSGETLSQSKQTFDMISKVFEEINLFGKKGVKSVITVNSDGYFAEEKDTIDISIDIEQLANAISKATDTDMSGAPKEKLNITIEAVTKYSDINKIKNIDIPKLTNGNSIDFNALSKLKKYGAPNVLLNGKLVEFEDVSPKMVNDRTMVPMRKIFESLGATVDYNDWVITAVKGDKTIKHKIGENVIYVNDAPIEMDVASFETDGRTLVPVRFISNALGAYVDWENELQAVVITEE